ncbi:molybdenum cofactor sulfurase [Aurantimonas sp. VKM B-3413]|nr:MOSC domain-containing protein [Aurantimonas sp. VKM B-3413]MCB8836533.1 molybdenum cofactor sulfurase [Aurantimonas sp. VKM B-3413]
MEVEIRRGRRLKGRVAGLYQTAGNGFETTPVEQLTLTFSGIAGDRHEGVTRRSGGREPWYPRGTEMRNERQLSLLSQDELDGVATDLEIDRLMPEWIGGNLLVEGIARLSLLPPRTVLFFASGASIRIDGDNAPCRLAGRAIAAHCGRPRAEFDFPKLARHRRGLVAWVEKPGVVTMGETFEARIPEQWVYP